MNTLKFKKGDIVAVMVGKDKGKTGKVERVFPKRFMVVVEGVNQYKKHLKARTANQKSEIVTITKPLHVSKLSFIDPKTKKPSRVGYIFVKGEKVRVSKKSGEKI